MKKIFLTILILSSSALFSACINQGNNVATDNANPVTNSNINVSQDKVNDEGKETTYVPLEKTKYDDQPISFNMGQHNDDVKIISTMEKDGAILRNGETINPETGKIEKYKEFGKLETPDKLVVRRIYENGKKVVIIRQIKNNKSYSNLYVQFPDGSQDSATTVSYKNEDGIVVTEYIKEPKNGYFL